MSPTRIIYWSLLPQSRYDSKNFQVVLLSFQKYIFQSTFKKNLFFKYCHKDKHAPHRFSTWIFNKSKLPLIKHTVLFNKLAFSAVWIILTRIIYLSPLSNIFLDIIMKFTYRWFNLFYYNNSKTRFFIVLSKKSFFKYCHKDKYAPHRFSTWNSTTMSYYRSSTLQNKVVNGSIREVPLIKKPVHSFSAYE